MFVEMQIITHLLSNRIITSEYQSLITNYKLLIINYLLIKYHTNKKSVFKNLFFQIKNVNLQCRLLATVFRNAGHHNRQLLLTKNNNHEKNRIISFAGTEYSSAFSTKRHTCVL